MKKEIITYDEMHGLVFDERTLSFNEKLCKEMLLVPLDQDSTREFLQCSYLINYMKQFQLKPKTQYGDLNVSLDQSFESLSSYEQQIENKIKGVVTLEEVEKQIKVMGNVLNLDKYEVQMAENSVNNTFIQQLNLQPVVKRLKI
jgi:uncharacterized protein YheU (UPF0270 family)